MRRLVCSLFPAALVLALCPVFSFALWQPDGIRVSYLTQRQYYPVIAADGAGGAIIAWRQQSGELRAQRLDGAGVAQWGANGVVVCTQETSGPSIISDGAGGAFVAWPDERFFGDTSQLYAQRIGPDGTAQWTTDGVLVCALAAVQSPSIVLDGAGGVIVSFNRSGNIFAQRLTPNGSAVWITDGVALCTANKNQYAPHIVADGVGGAIVSWDDQRIGSQIYAQRISATGSLQYATNGNLVCSGSGAQSGNAIISDGAHNAIITWQDDRNGAYDIYAQRLYPNGSTQWAPDGVPVCTATQAQAYPEIISIGPAESIIVWEDQRDGAAHKLYAQRLDAAGAAQWSANGVPLSTRTGVFVLQKMVTDGAGGAIVAWQASQDPVSDPFTTDICAQRINGSGAIQWTPAGIAVCTAPYSQEYVTLTPDGAGGAFAAWDDGRANAYKIYAQHISSDGSVPTPVSALTPRLSVMVGSNYPNPFPANTSLDVTLRQAMHVGVSVFDAAGRRVRTMDLGNLPAGSSRLTFDGLDDRAHELPSGVYFYRVHAGDRTVTKKMVIAR
jgi:hypothetical protein